jgi:ankyrin repeat protein
MLMIAARSGCVPMVATLLSAGAEVNAVAQVWTENAIDDVLPTIGFYNHVQTRF